MRDSTRELAGPNSWKVSFAERRPLVRQPMVRIPNKARVAVGGSSHRWEGRAVTVEIRSKERVVWRGTLDVSSRGELYVQRKVRDLVSRETELTIVLGARPERGSTSSSS